jgi:GAF domain-containing protein
MSGEGYAVPVAQDPTWLTELQAVLLTGDGLGAFLDELAQLTVRALPVHASCGVTLQPNGHVRTVAASDDLAMRVDEIQYETGQGPCLDSLATGVVNHVVDLGAEPRWPMFCTAALGHGVRSSLSTPLNVHGETVGALNLYATDLDAFDAEARSQALIFAGHAAGAVGVALRMAREAQISADLRTALASRAIIDQAMGIIMAQQRCSADEAFAVLRRASQQRNVKIHAIAASIVAGVTGQPPRTTRFSPRS